MREIKFEYTFQEQNTWEIRKRVFWLDDLESIDMDEFLYELDLNDYRDSLDREENWEIWKIITRSEYTWLKDKNWVEIYEWYIITRDSFVEILRKDTNWTIRLDTKIYLEIVFDDWQFCWKKVRYDIIKHKDMCELDYNDKKKKFMWEIMSLPNEMIIIWNIYENPGLLTNQ